MRNFLLLVLLFSVLETHSQVQVTEVVSGLAEPSASMLVGNDLYFTQSDFVNFTNGKLSRIDITDATPVIEDIFTGFVDGPGSIVINGNQLIFTEQSTIYGVDISAATPELEIIFQFPQDGSIFAVEDIALAGNDLYMVDSWNNIITRIDITESDPEAVTVLDNLSGPTSMLIDGELAYITEYDINSVSRFKINDPAPATEVISSDFFGPLSLALIGNDLYVAEFRADKISYIDISQTSPVLVDLISGLEGPVGLDFVGNTLYFSETFNGTISRIELAPVSVEDQSENSGLQVSPNPASSFVQISGLTASERYSIVNSLGQIVESGNVVNNGQINVSNLDSGFYNILFKNTQSSSTFVKH